MKKLLLPIVMIYAYAITGMAQAPEKFSYQAVIRDASNNLVVNQTVGIQISIRQGMAAGTIVYQETHAEMTNANGLVSLEVGGGAPTMILDFSDIDWGVGPYYIQTGIDPTGGVDYSSIMGTTELISVPYALYSSNTKRGPFYVGLDTLGGVVFYVHTDAQGNQRGLIVAIVDQSTGAQWSNITSTLIGPGAQSTWDGAANTAAIIGQGATSGAAILCNNYSITTPDGTFDDWYLPAIDELILLWQNRYEVHKAFGSIGGVNLVFGGYWSSTEFAASNAWIFDFFAGNNSVITKNVNVRVRAVRAFSYSTN